MFQRCVETTLEVGVFVVVLWCGVVVWCCFLCWMHEVFQLHVAGLMLMCMSHVPATCHMPIFKCHNSTTCNCHQHGSMFLLVDVPDQANVDFKINNPFHGPEHDHHAKGRLAVFCCLLPYLSLFEAASPLTKNQL